MKTCLDICKKCVCGWESRVNAKSFEGWTEIDDHHWSEESYVFCPPQPEKQNHTKVQEQDYPPQWCKFITEIVMLKDVSEHPERAKRKV